MEVNKVEIFKELIKREPNFLDKSLEELIPISYIGQAAVSFCRDKLKLMNQLNVAEEQKKATLADGQDAGKMLLEIEARIGELLPKMPDGLRKGEEAEKISDSLEETRMNKKQRNNARTIASHPEAVAEVIKEAEEDEDIPTKGAVLNKIRAKKAEERAEKAEAYAQEMKEKGLKKEVEESTVYQGYLVATRIFKHELELAIEGVKQGLFASESKGWINKRHDEIYELMTQLEDLL